MSKKQSTEMDPEKREEAAQVRAALKKLSGAPGQEADEMRARLRRALDDLERAPPPVMRSVSEAKDLSERTLKMIEIDEKGIGQEFLDTLAKWEPHAAIALQKVVDQKKDDKEAFRMVAHFMQAAVATLFASGGESIPANIKVGATLLGRIDSDLEDL